MSASKLSTVQTAIINVIKTQGKMDLSEIAYTLDKKEIGVRSSLSALVKKGLVIESEGRYSLNPSNDNIVTTKENEEVKNMVTKAQKAAQAAQAAQAAATETETVTHATALAETGETQVAPLTDGKREGETAAEHAARVKATKKESGVTDGTTEKAEKPKAPKKEVVTREDGVEIPGYPRVGGKTRQVWDELDAAVNAAVNAYFGDASCEPNAEALNEHPLDRKSLVAKVVSGGINPATVSTQYAQWRQYHIAKGNYGKVEEMQNAVKLKEQAAKEAEKAAKAAKKAEEKAAKAAKKAEEKAAKEKAKEEAKTAKTEAPGEGTAE